MGKPIGFYVSGHALIDELENQYGSTFEKLQRIEKLILLQGLVNSMVNVEKKMIGYSPAASAEYSMQPVVERINKELPSHYLLEISDAVVNQLKYQR